MCRCETESKGEAYLPFCCTRARSWRLLSKFLAFYQKKQDELKVLAKSALTLGVAVEKAKALLGNSKVFESI